MEVLSQVAGSTSFVRTEGEVWSAGKNYDPSGGSTSKGLKRQNGLVDLAKAHSCLTQAIALFIICILIFQNFYPMKIQVITHYISTVKLL
jgi:hypothetical protein